MAKAQLDIAIGGDGDTWTVANNEAGIEALLKDLRSRNCGLVVREATGGLRYLLSVPLLQPVFQSSSQIPGRCVTSHGR